MNTVLETIALEEGPIIPRAAQERRLEFSDLVQTCDHCSGVGWEPGSYSSNTPIETLLRYSIGNPTSTIRPCKKCAGKKRIPSPSGRALIELLSLPAVAEELAPIFAARISDPRFMLHPK